MIHLQEENITGNKLTHMTHIEDLVLGGELHCQLALRTLKDVFNTLKGNTENPTKITVKVDGSPSFLCASNYYGKSFVATKSYLNSAKRPHATTPEECEVLWNDKPDLCYKMQQLLKYAPMLNIPKDEIWQGDFLFANKDLKKLVVDDEECITYHPNTLVYAIPVKDPLATKISRSEIGVCWHTRYRGDSVENLKITFDATVDETRNVPAIFQTDVRIPSIAGRVTFTEDETNMVAYQIASIEKDIDLITSHPKYLEIIKYNEEGFNLVSLLNIFRNVVIKKGSEDPTLEDFIEWVTARINKEAATKKLQATRDKYYAKLNNFTSYLYTIQDTLEEIWNIQSRIVLVKEFYISKLEKLNSIKSFVHLIDQGYLPSTGEGFVVSDIDGNVQKLVTRLGFSRRNFSNETVKGWMSDARAKQQLGESSTLTKDNFFKKLAETLQTYDLKKKSLKDKITYNLDKLYDDGYITEPEYLLIKSIRYLKEKHTELQNINTEETDFPTYAKHSNTIMLRVDNGNRSTRAATYDVLKSIIDTGDYKNSPEVYIDYCERRTTGDPGSSQYDKLVCFLKNKHKVTLILGTGTSVTRTGNTLDAKDWLQGLPIKKLDIASARDIWYVANTKEELRKSIKYAAEELFTDCKDIKDTVNYIITAAERTEHNLDLSAKELQKKDLIYGNNLQDLLISLAEVAIPLLAWDKVTINNKDILPSNLKDSQIKHVLWNTKSNAKYLDSIIEFTDGSRLLIQNKGGEINSGTAITTYIREGVISLDNLINTGDSIGINIEDIKKSTVYNYTESYNKMLAECRAAAPASYWHYTLNVIHPIDNNGIKIPVTEDAISSYYYSLLEIINRSSKDHINWNGSSYFSEDIKAIHTGIISSFIRYLDTHNLEPFKSYAIKTLYRYAVDSSRNIQDNVNAILCMSGLFAKFTEANLNEDGISIKLIKECLRNAYSNIYVCKLISKGQDIHLHTGNIDTVNSVKTNTIGAANYTTLNGYKLHIKGIGLDII